MRVRGASVWMQRIAIGVVAAIVAVVALRVGTSASQSVRFRDLTAWLPNTSTGEVVLAHAGGGRGEIVARVQAAAPGEQLVVAQSGSGAVVLNRSKSEVGQIDGVTLTLAQKASVPNVGPDTQLVSSAAGVRVVTVDAVHLLDPVTALPAGSVPLDAPLRHAVASDDGLIYGIGTDGALVAVGAGAARVALPDGAEPATVVGAGGEVYVVDRNGPQLRILDEARTGGATCLRGALAPGAELVTGGSAGRATPYAVVVDGAGGVRITDLRHDRCTSVALLNGGRFGAPVVAAGLVYLPLFTTPGGEIIVLNASEGSVVGRYALGLPVGRDFEVFEKDDTVWFNDPSGSAAGVLGREAVLLRFDKSTGATAGASGATGSVSRPAGAGGAGGGAGTVTGATGTRVSGGTGGSGASGSSGASGGAGGGGRTGASGSPSPGAGATGSGAPSAGAASSDPNVAPVSPGTRTGLVADFTYTARTVRVGQTVTFSDTSSGNPTAWTWEFGDGTFATGPKATHAWTQPGSFTVTLRVENDAASAAASVAITVVPESARSKPEADFRFTSARVEVGQDVTFSDRSSGDPTDWQWNFGDGSGASGSTVSHAYRTPGLYEVVLTATNAFGSDTSSPALITVFDKVEPPVAIIGGGANSANVGQPVGFFSRSSGNPTQISWNFGDGTGANGSVVQKTWSRAGTYTVTLTVSNSAGANTATAAIVVNDITLAPVSRFTASQTTAEEGQSIRFQSLSINNPTTLAWDFGDGSTASGTSVTHAFARVGSYQVRLRAVNAAGSDESSQTISVVAQLPAPVASFSFDPSIITAGAAVLFSDESSGGTPTTWSWDFGDGSPSVGQRNPTHRFDRAGNFVVRLTVSNAKGTSSTQRTVNVLPAAPEPAFTFSPALPQTGQPVQFTDTSGGGAGTSWLWNFGDGTTSTQRNPSKVFAANGIYDVRLSVTNASGSAFVVRRVEVNPSPPVAAFTVSPAAPTTGTPVVFRNTSTGGDATTIRWDFGDGPATSSERNASYVYTAPGTYTVRLTMQNASGTSTATAGVVVTVPPPVASFTSSTPAVAGRAVQFTNTSTGGPFTTLAWTFGDGTATGTGATPTYVYAVAGSYDVRLTVTNAGGTVSTTRRITVVPPITATFTVSPVRVAGTPITFTNTTAGGPFASLTWTFGDGSTATGSTVSHPYAAAGTYTVRLDAEATTGATDSATQTISVAPPVPVASFTTSLVSPARTVRFENTSTGGPSFSSIVWDFGDGSPTATGSVVTHTYGAGASFPVRLTVTNVTGTGTTNPPRTVVPVAPVASFSANPAGPARTFTFTNTSANGPFTSIDWDFGDTFTATGATATHTFAAAGTYDVLLTVSNGSAVATTTVTLTVV
jgi:PKD repeat protein